MTMQSKTVLVTGATSGIGLVTARELARMGARVFAACRDVDRCNNAQESIRNQTGNQQVEYLCADLSSVQGTRTLADELMARTDHLDVLVNNAGAFFYRLERSEDGYEMTFALNHLSYFLLTNLLLDLLKASGTPESPARVVSVSSAAQSSGTLYEAVLLGEAPYRGFQSYSASKLCNVVFTYELARRLQGQPVTANTLHPGLVATNFAMNNFNGILKPFAALYRKLSPLFVRTPEKGAETSIWLASAPEAAQYTGVYFVDCKPARTNPLSYDLEAAARLWEMSERMTGLMPG